MNFYKINKEYSFILFFFTLIFLVIEVINLSYEIPFLNLICFCVISSIGITHGALDDSKGYKILNRYKVKQKYLFYFAYIFTSLLVILFWLIFPLITLSSFLFIASYHFGKEDSYFIKVKKNKIINLFFLLKGSIVILAPLVFHNQETLEIFKILNVNYSYINDEVLISILVLSFLSNFFITKDSIVSIVDWSTVLFLNLSFSPLIAFTIYFCFLHSVRHSFSLIYEIDKKNFNNGAKKFLKKALPLTVVTAILFIVSVYVLTNYYVLDDAILKVIFIGLASLTFPHILLEYLIEKNEK